MTQFLSKDHPIIEKGRMEFQPFGRTSDGKRIDDVSGVPVGVWINFLEETVARKKGREASKQVVEELARLLNERIADAAYHVTPTFLKNPWNSYSYEFLLFMTSFCMALAEEPDSHQKVGKRHIHPIIQTLGRPFSVQQIFKMASHFGSKFIKAIRFEPIQIEENHAIIRITYSENALRQFGRYRKACVSQICSVVKAACSSVPEAVHGLLPARVVDRACAVDNDDYCEWDITWESEKKTGMKWLVGSAGAVASTFIILRFLTPSSTFYELCLLSLIPAFGLWELQNRFVLRKELRHRGEIITEQAMTTDARHEELREAYLEQEQRTADLRRRVSELTLLHQTGLLLTSTRDPDALISSALGILIKGLHYDRAMLSFYDATSSTVNNAWVIGVGEEGARFEQGFEIIVKEVHSLEGTVLLRGGPLLVKDLAEIPISEEWIRLIGTKAFIAVPLKVKDRVLGLIAAGRVSESPPGEGDLEVMVTFANQLAVGIDNARAYREIEELNIGLEAKVHQRTAELEAANRRLHELDDLKSQFLAHVSHELRTPLTSIQGFADNMLDELGGPITPKQKQNLQRITANAGRLHRMICNLLDQSRIEAGKIQLSLTKVQISKLVEDVIENLQPPAEAKQQSVDLLCLDPQLFLWADTDLLRQVVTNLLDNAIKYTPKFGHIQVVVTRQVEGFARLSVIDDGPGIPQEALPRIFELFYRVDSGGGKEVKGFGLGLSIVKRLVELHDGQVTLESEEGKGASFHVTLPALQSAITESDETMVMAKRLLVVDDDPDIRQFLVDRLIGAGYALKTATSGREAVELLSAETFDGAILDLGLPELDGIAVLQHLRSQNIKMPVLIITAAEARERAMQAVETGAQAYLLKPFNASQFERIISQCFGRNVPNPNKGE